MFGKIEDNWLRFKKERDTLFRESKAVAVIYILTWIIGFLWFFISIVVLEITETFNKEIIQSRNVEVLVKVEASRHEVIDMWFYNKTDRNACNLLHMLRIQTNLLCG